MKRYNNITNLIMFFILGRAIREIFKETPDVTYCIKSIVLIMTILILRDAIRDIIWDK